MINFGCSNSICRSRNGKHAASFSLAGVRLPGGRHFDCVGDEDAPAREAPIEASIASSNLPAWPTGLPSDPSARGPSPTMSQGRPSVTNAGYGEFAPFAQTQAATAGRPLEPAPIQAARRWPRAEREASPAEAHPSRGLGALQAFDSRSARRSCGRAFCGMAVAATSRTARNRPQMFNR